MTVYTKEQQKPFKGGKKDMSYREPQKAVTRPHFGTKRIPRPPKDTTE
jgi:hypothetical protein